jgi:hypothetical protein
LAVRHSRAVGDQHGRCEFLANDGAPIGGARLARFGLSSGR